MDVEEVVKSKKHILLVNPVVREWAQPNCFPVGLGYIAAVLDWAGHEVLVLDLNAERVMTLSSLQGWEPDIVGLTGIITQYAEVKALAYIARTLWPNTPVVCGGPLATSVPELLLRRTAVTHCVLGEGEDTIREFVARLSDHVPGVYYKAPLDAAEGVPVTLMLSSAERRPIADLESLPYPAYDRFPLEIYINNPIAADNVRKWQGGGWVTERKQRRSLNMLGTRGCPHHCVYCYHNFLGQGYRTRAPSDIVDEMAMLGQKYGVKYIHFTDDAFACVPRFVERFCHAIQERCVMSKAHWGITWSCAGRADVMTEDLVGMMADAGCEGLCYGLESGSQRMLDAMNKRVTLEQYRRAIAFNKKYFKYEDYTFIVGTPGETWDTVKESVRFCKDEGVTPSAVFYMTPYPGTPLFERLRRGDARFGAMVEDGEALERFVMSLGEQGERLAWNCSGRPDEEVREWHQYFVEETGAWNRKSSSRG